MKGPVVWNGREWAERFSDLFPICLSGKGKETLTSFNQKKRLGRLSKLTIAFGVFPLFLL